MVSKVKFTRKLLHLDFLFKIYYPLWSLECFHVGKYLRFQQAKEMESSKAKRKLMEQMKKTTFLSTKYYDKVGDLITSTRMQKNIFTQQRRGRGMSKSQQNIEETLQRFLTNPEDIENNVVLKRIEEHMKGQFKIKIKVNYPIVLDANGIPQQAHFDSLYIADPAK